MIGNLKARAEKLEKAAKKAKLKVKKMSAWGDVAAKIAQIAEIEQVREVMLADSQQSRALAKQMKRGKGWKLSLI